MSNIYRSVTCYECHFCDQGGNRPECFVSGEDIEAGPYPMPTEKCYILNGAFLYTDENDKWKEEWIRFLNGKWQKEVPKKPGRYPQALAWGEYQGDMGLIYEHPKKGLVVIKEWGGWWWSEPFPKMPKPPEWNSNK